MAAYSILTLKLMGLPGLYNYVMVVLLGKISSQQIFSLLMALVFLYTCI